MTRRISQSESLIQGVGCLLGIPAFIEQRHKPASYYRSRRILPGTVESLPVAYAETGHARILKSETFHMPEVLRGTAVKTVSCPCGARTAHHVYEAFGVIVYKTYAFIVRLRGNHHYHAHSVFVRKRLYTCKIIGKRQIRDDDSRHPAVDTPHEEPLQTVAQYHVEIAHDDYRNGYLRPHLVKL